MALFRRAGTLSPGLNRIFGVRVRLHYTWIPAVILITAAVVTQFSTDYPLWQRIVLGIAACVLYFLAIGTREFIINLIAVNKGITVTRVTLFVFGGVLEVDKDTTRPSLELLLAVGGMVSNLVIAGIFFILYTALAHTGSIVVHVLVQWLAFICFMLTLLHFVPAFPLDAGMALRALLWRMTGSYQQATGITGWAGWAIGLLIAAGGVLTLVTIGEWFTGVFLLAVGLALQSAATNGRRWLLKKTPAPGP